MKLHLIYTAAAVALLAVGCADVRPNGRAATASERAAAMAQVEQLRALTAVSRQPSRAPGLLVAIDFAPAMALLAPDGTPAPVPSRRPIVELGSCLTSIGRAATYNECEVDEHIIHGSVFGLGGDLSAELVDVFIVGPDEHGATTIDASLNTTAGAINGRLRVDTVWTAADSDHLLDATIRAEDLLLDDKGCPVGGSLQVRGAVDGERAAVTLWFGPGCGDLTIAP